MMWGCSIRRELDKLALCSLFMFGCVLVNLLAPRSANAADNSKTVVVLIDLSDSTQQFRKEYVQDFRLILDTLSAGDKLLVSRIVKHASNADPLPIQLALAEQALGDNPRKAQQQRWKLETEALIRFEELVAPTDNVTPITEVLEKVPRWFTNFPSRRKIVVLMSDMRESSRTTVDFDSKSGWTPTIMDTFLARLKKDQLIPDLAGVRIYVAGARDIDDRRLRAVKVFWQRYFEAAKADLAPQRYEAKLVLFDECNEVSACENKFFRNGHEVEVRKYLGKSK